MTSPESFIKPDDQPVYAFTSDEGAEFRKSSFSDSGGCVAVAWPEDGRVLVADDKDQSLVPHSFSREEWQIFVDGVKHGQFDNPPA
jgi:hypothetical protein